jgi:subtilisin family serine protease
MPNGLDDQGRLDEGTLRRFVFQTYGRARRTQDSPIMPDVWLKYIGIAERIARHTIAVKTDPTTAGPPPPDTIDLLLTPWSGVRPGVVLERLMQSIGDDFGTAPNPAKGVQRTPPYVAVSDTRVVVDANFKTLVCHIVPLSSWWLARWPDDRNYETKFSAIIKGRDKPRGQDAEFARYFALVGFIECLLWADSKARVARLAALAEWLGTPDADPKAGGINQLETLDEVYEVARRLLLHAVDPVPLSTVGPAAAAAPAAEGISTAEATPAAETIPTAEGPPTAEQALAAELGPLDDDSSADEEATVPGIFLISLNRPATQSLYESRATTKADAAHRVFDIDTSTIAFAVIDGGIDATHPAFVDRSRREITDLGDKLPPSNLSLKFSRVKATYDFTRLRALVAFAISSVPKGLQDEVDQVFLAKLKAKAAAEKKAAADEEAALGETAPREVVPDEEVSDDNTAPGDKATVGANAPLDGKATSEAKAAADAKAILERASLQTDMLITLYEANPTAFHHLAIRGKNARDLDWEIVRPLIAVSHEPAAYRKPQTDHGTHVAGILAAYLPKRGAGLGNQRELSGMCRNLRLYDLRVFDDKGRSDEYTILSALEFLGWMNKDRANPVVHGANLSLALAHDVDSFACGQTPICDVCNYLVGAGTVIVAAAGNTGFESGAGPQKQSIGTGYRPISITDPGNADSVITVGSTHRRDPHLYGVSYFSARGPTGDGRRKPDILAPGEKITSTIRDRNLQRMDGTSMAAPHVSGAAAMLMARYPELIGRPLRIKQILMDSATDLKREPSFQGAGLVDVLRALQSV